MRGSEPERVFALENSMGIVHIKNAANILVFRNDEFIPAVNKPLNMSEKSRLTKYIMA